MSRFIEIQKDIIVMNKWMIWVAAVSIAVTGFAGTAYDLTTERETAPLGLDTAQPRFSWKMKPEMGKVGQQQTAYRILVATSPDKLREGRTDVWDSGKIAGPVSVLVEGIPTLKSRSRYVWTDAVWRLAMSRSTRFCIRQYGCSKISSRSSCE